ncbi:unnamed protein product [Brassica oleracea]
MCTNMVHQLSKISTWTVHEKDQHADMCGQCADMYTDGQYSCAKITRPVHGKGQRAESKDQRAESKDQHSQRGPKSPGQSTGRASVLICVLMDRRGGCFV